MKRTILLTSLALSACIALRAQALTSITIGTSVQGIAGSNPIFIVDGTQYLVQQNFVWPVGSKHIVQFPFSLDANGANLAYQSRLGDAIRYQFGNWVANTSLFTQGASPLITVTADPGLTSLIAQVTAQYSVQIRFDQSGATQPNSSCSGAPSNPPQDGMREGIIYFNGACYGDSAFVYVNAGTYTLNAFPYPGWVFYGFLIGTQPPNAYNSINITAPTTITPLFSIGKRVNFITNPPGLKVIIDGSPINTPPASSPSSDGVTCAPDETRLPVGAPLGFQPLCLGQFDFLPGSKHTIGADVPQMDVQGNYWVFSGFSNGLGQNATYVAGTNTSTPDTVVANFVPGVRVSILTNPTNLKLMIDGRDNWLNYNFVWGQGETHHIVAESPQTDRRNRVWQFKAWSDQGDGGHDITIPAVRDFAVTATYNGLSQITFGSSPESLNFTVDGAACVAPCVVNKTNGSQTQVAAPASVPAGPGTRYDFVSWSDGNTSPARTVSFNQDTLSLTANYQTSYQFTGLLNPAKAGTFKLSPASTDGYYPSGTQVTVGIAANGGFKFAHWEYDLTGQFSSGTLTMNAPRTVQADFATVPFIPPAGIQSVTGPTPDGSVAPGSIVAIYGENLAPALQIGPTNPLAQTLGNVTITVGNFLLPLVFVSPEQIGAQIPWELADGNYTLVIHSPGLPDVSGNFTVARNAPGVFTQANNQNLPLILALHADGSLVNFDNPAVHGEQITIYATGLGPYDHPAVDGFPASSADKFVVTDPLTVDTDSGVLQPDWAGAAPGMVGVSIVKLTITGDMPSANLNLALDVNGKQSAQVVLPIQ